MTEARNKQIGFSIIEALVILAAIGILAGGGWLVYQHNRTKTANAAAASSQAATTSQQPSTTTQPAPTVAYLTIKEWGIKLPLSDSIKDAYYTVSVGSGRGADGQPNTLLLGLKSLDSSGCAATNNTAVALIFRALPTETDSATGKLLTQEYPSGVTIGNYFYGYQVLNSIACKAPRATLKSVDSAFTNAEKGIATAAATN